jgi:hypothetical protein
MAGVLQHLRSSTLDKRPNPASMVDGQVAINYASGAPGMFFKDSNGALVKVGPVHVGSGAPNAVPASGGTAGNSIGEQWLDTSGGTYVFKIWDGSAWRSEAGEFVNVTGDTMTGALVMPNGSAASPALAIGSSDNGLYSPGTDQVAISTNASQRLLIDSSGNIGINGTIAGTAKLQVSGALRLFGSGDGTETSNACLFQASGGGLGFGVNSSQRMILDTSGRLGLGTSSPHTRFHVDATKNTTAAKITTSGALFNSDYTQLGFGAAADSSSDSTAIRNVFTNALTNLQSDLTFLTHTGSSLTEKVRITSGGSVGIGTQTPGSYNSAADNLVVADSGSGGITIATGTSNYGSIYFADGTSGADQYRGVLEYNHSNNAMAFFTDGSEKFRCDSSGRLLVGTSSSSANTRAVIAGRSDGNPAGTLMMEGTSATPANGDVFGQIRFSAAAPSGSNSGVEIAASRDGGTWTNNSSMPSRLSFFTTADGASSPTERMRITSTGQVRLAGAGITFNGDTAAANELDDYEYGTWTPAYQTSNGDISITSTTVSHAVYTKIGNRVFCTCRFFSNVASGGTGTVRVTGLPFTTASTQGDVSCAVSLAVRFNTAAPVTATARASSTQLDLLTVYTDTTAGGNVTYMPAANLRTGGTLNILSISFNYAV